MSTPDKEMHAWDSYYEEALAGLGQEANINLWWQIADRDLIEAIVPLFPQQAKELHVLEAGCGSASSSFLLCKNLNINKLTLLDISQKALVFAKLKYEKENLPTPIEYIPGNIFDLCSCKDSFDLTWNVGLIEHYEKEDIKKIISQMELTLKPGGFLAIGIPNKRSIAVRKAAFLGSKFGQKFFKWVPGYRNETEILYSEKEIIDLFRQVNPSYHPIIRYAGSPLWVGAPEKWVSFFDRRLKCQSASFITLFIVQRRS